MTRNRVLMLLENNGYPQDGRVRREALSLTAAGYRVSVICPRVQGQPLREELANVSVYRFPAPPAANGLWGYLLEYGYAMLAAFLLSIFVFVRRGFDVIHAHNPPDTFACIAALYKLLGKRFIFDHHDLAPEMYYARFHGRGNRLVYLALEGFERLSCKLADRVIATNESYQAVETERTKIPKDRITIVRNGPDLNRLRPVSPLPGLKQDGRTVIGYVGEMGFHDGVDYLLRALRLLIDDLGRTDFLCILVGAGDAIKSLKSQARDLHLSEHILFTGWVDHTEVARYLSAADIGAAPEPSNPYNDRCTIIKMMEYMALGKPIVAFNLPEHRITARNAAVYARPNDELDFARQIVRLMDSPAARHKMGCDGRVRVETKLAWSHQEQHLLSAYEALRLPGGLRAYPKTENTRCTAKI